MQVVSRFGLTVTTLTLLFTGLIASSAEVPNNSANCADLVMLFARGSSSNLERKFTDKPFLEDFAKVEEVPGAFFQWMEKRIVADYPHIDYKAISIHKSNNGWSPNGYPAVGIFDFNPFQQNFHNMVSAEFDWWPAGEYQNSVGGGAIELSQQVNYETTNCPNQRIVVGGYSQGAHVVHEALNLIPQNQRNLIDNVVLFGDPKFVAADYNKYNPFSKPKAYPWHRGTAGLKEQGLADALDPYVPEDMKYKTISWCHEDDFVCTGVTGLSWALSMNAIGPNSPGGGLEKAIGDGHTRYPVFGVPEATEEVLANIKHHLLTLEIERGGIDPNTDSYRKAYDGTLKNNRPIDVMFAFNNTAGIEDAHAQYYQNLRGILKQYQNNFPELKVGSVLYTDMLGGSGLEESSVAAYTQKPNQLSANVDSMYAWTPYLFGIGGGGDYPENHGMAVERSAMFANWRTDARKHVVIFAERPALESWLFDVCNSSIVSVLPHPGETPCATGTTYDTSKQPEWCSNIYHTLSGQTCPFTGSGSRHVVSRTIEDAILLAQAKGFTIDIVQPHTARNNQQDYTPEYAEENLRKLAESTGGLYLLYDKEAFGEAQMRDAIWQILNHDATLMKTKSFSPGSLLTKLSSDADTILPFTGLAVLPKDTPLQLTVNPVAGAQSYSWDILGDDSPEHTTNAPTLEVVLGEDTKNFVTVKAFKSPEVTNLLATVSIAVKLTDPVADYYEKMENDGLKGVSATKPEGSNTVTVLWETDGLSEGDIVVVFDPVSGIPISSLPATQGRYIYELSEALQYVEIQLVGAGSEGPRQYIKYIEQVTPPAPVLPVRDQSGEVGQTADKNVTQKEPQTIAAPRVEPVTTGTSSNAAGQSTSTTPPSITQPISSLANATTEVLSARSGSVGTATKPSIPSKVTGNIAALPLLAQEESGGIHVLLWLVILMVLGGVTIFVFYVVIKKRENDDEEKA